MQVHDNTAESSVGFVRRFKTCFVTSSLRLRRISQITLLFLAPLNFAPSQHTHTPKGDCVHEVEAPLRHAQPLPRVARAAAERDRRGYHAGEHAEGARDGDQGPAGPGLPQVARSPGRPETDARGTGEHRRPGMVRVQHGAEWAMRAGFFGRSSRTILQTTG